MNSKNENEVGRLLKQGEVAARLGLSKAWMERSRWLGNGPRYVKFGSAVRYRSQDVEEYLTERLTSSTSTGGRK